MGAIQHQSVAGETGVLLADPSDLDAYGDAVCRLLSDPALAARLGAAARERVRGRFLEPRHLTQWVDLVADVFEG